MYCCGLVVTVSPVCVFCVNLLASHPSLRSSFKDKMDGEGRTQCDCVGWYRLIDDLLSTISIVFCFFSVRSSRD